MDEENPWFVNLFLNNPIPRFIFNAESLKILRVNIAALEQYGYSEDEFLTKTLYDLRPADGHQQLTNVTTGLRETDVYLGDVRHLTKDKKNIWVQISAHPIEYKGAQARLVQALDITEKKENDRRLGEL